MAFNPFTITGFPIYSGFFLFVEGAERVADEELLATFGYDDGLRRIERSELMGLNRKQSAEYLGGGISRFVVVAETAGWKVIADDFMYTLWHQNSTRSRIVALAKEYDLLCFSDGDVDGSYALRRFKNGQLVREFIVDDPRYGSGGGQEVLVDFGDRLPGELGLQRKGIRAYLQAVVGANGFDVNEAVGSARLWLGEPIDWRNGTRGEGETQRRTGSWRT